MALDQTAGRSSGPLQNGYSLASYNAAYLYVTLASTIDENNSPGRVIKLLNFQIWFHAVQMKFMHCAQVVGLIEFYIKHLEKLQQRQQQQHTHNSSSSPAMASDSTFAPQSLSNGVDSTVWLKKFNDHDREDDQDQDSPEGDEDPTTAMPRSLVTLRFACHFHKHTPSRYCAAGCGYKTCEHPGWENIAGVK
jgi:hypothetical protein